MPEGPFGLNRITSIGPLASDDVTVEFEEERDTNPALPQELKELISHYGWNTDEITRVERRVKMKQEPEEMGVKILDEFQQGITDLGERIAYIKYYILSNGRGYIHQTEVDRRLWRKGIASEMREDVLQDMDENGVEAVYSYPSTRAGKKFVKSQGFIKAERPGFLVRYL